MQKLLAIEWLKIKNYRTFRILIGLFLVFLPLWNWAIYNSVISVGAGAVNILSQAYSFPAVWGNLGFWAGIFVYFLSILMIILVSNEYSFRTHRQNVIDGWSRLDFFHAKAGLVLAISLGATVYTLLVGLVAGLLVGGFSGMGSGLEKILFFFVYTLNYLSFSALLALWIRRSGLAIGLFFLYSFIIENLFRGLINWKSSWPVGNLLPLQASDELLPFPIAKMLSGLISKGPVFSDWIYLLMSCAWIVVYYFLGKRLMQQRDF